MATLSEKIIAEAKQERAILERLTVTCPCGKVLALKDYAQAWTGDPRPRVTNIINNGGSS